MTELLESRQKLNNFPIQSLIIIKTIYGCVYHRFLHYSNYLSRKCKFMPLRMYVSLFSERHIIIIHN